MLLESLFLTELDWFDHSKTPKLLEPFRNKGLFVHFSSIPKIGPNHRLGIKNTFRNHRDPVGIYLYPIDWIFDSGSERVRRGMQYGVNSEYYFICDVDLGSNGLTLSKVTWEQIDSLAKKNGWFDKIEWWRSLDDDQKAKNKSLIFPYYSNPEIPGNFLWHFVEYLERKEPRVISWNAAFKGLTYIYDDNTKTIHNNEPHQLLVLDPRILRVIKSGQQFRKNERTDKNSFDYWRPAIVSVMNDVIRKYNGVIKWVNVDKPFDSNSSYQRMSKKPKEPRAFFTIGDKNFTLKFSMSYTGASFWLNYTFKKAIGELKIVVRDDKRDIKYIEDSSKDELVAEIDKAVDQIMALKTDLLFEPAITETDMKSFVENIITDSNVTWDETTIENNLSDNSSSYYYDSITFSGKTETTTSVFCKIYKDEIYLSNTVRIDNIPVTHVNPPGSRNYKVSELDTLTDDLANAFKTSFDYTMNRYSSTKFDYKPKLYEDEIIPFKGWLALNCGLSLGGKIKTIMKTEIEEYLNRDDKAALVSRFKYIIRENR